MEVSPNPRQAVIEDRVQATCRHCRLSNYLEDSRMSSSMFQKPYPSARPKMGGHEIPGVVASRVVVLTYG